MKILEVRNLTKIFSGTRGWFKEGSPDFVAVDGITFGLEQGEILGFLGPNGAGKTTTISMLLSTLLPTSGSILYFGKDFAKHRSEILQQVGFASAYGTLPTRLTVYENLRVFAFLYGLRGALAKDRIDYYLKIFDIYHLKDRSSSTLSSGQATRLALTKAFLSNPKIVLLDEPTAALDPDIAAHVRRFVLHARQEFNTSIIFTSHNMAEVTQVCDRVIVLKRGRIIADDTPAQLARSVQHSRLRLFVGQELEKAVDVARTNGFNYTTHGEAMITLEVDEQSVANIIRVFTLAGVHYTQISIDEPTLEDYFIQVAST